jgi:hypothetical protein
MGQIKKGILGGFKGKVGTVVGTSWLNRDVMKSLPVTSGKLPTLKQALVRQRFGTGCSFLKPLSKIVRVCDQTQVDITKWNVLCKTAFAETLTLTSDEEHFNFNFAKIKIATGSIDGMCGYSLLPDDGEFLLSWNFIESLFAKGDDVLYIIFFDYENGRTSFFNTGVTRGEEQISFVIPTNFEASTTAVYAFFGSADGSKLSNSEFVNLDPTRSSEIQIPAKKLCAYQTMHLDQL